MKPGPAQVQPKSRSSQDHVQPSPGPAQLSSSPSLDSAKSSHIYIYIYIYIIYLYIYIYYLIRHLWETFPLVLHANYLMCWSMAVFPKETPICLPKTCCLPNVHFFWQTCLPKVLFKGELLTRFNLISEERVKFCEENSENLMKIG